ncbi:MAG TPA: hypothetical protein VFS21_34630, partial [Roseiflexaceae bacterium]|nr:hypothetical protein [Roseiflexaceae bacterium]
YFAMMYSRKWLVERDELQKEEIMNLPFPSSLDEIQFTIEDLINLSKTQLWENYVDHITNRMYNLNQEELILIDDAINYTLDRFRNKNSSYSSASTIKQKNSLQDYAETLTRTLQASFNSKFKATIFQGDSPLRVIALQAETPETLYHNLSFAWENQELEEVLRELEVYLTEQRTASIFIRRICRLIRNNIIYIVKPDQNRYWTRSIALRDADDIYIDIMTSWRQ